MNALTNTLFVFANTSAIPSFYGQQERRLKLHLQPRGWSKWQETHLGRYTMRYSHDRHRKVSGIHDSLIIQRNMALFFSGGDRKELKLRVTGRIWKEQQNPDVGVCIPNLCSCCDFKGIFFLCL